MVNGVWSALGQPPSDVQIKSVQINIDRDGNWSSDIEMEGNFAGVSMTGDGKWAMADGVVSYTSGAISGKSRVQLESGRLVLDPDFAIRKDGTIEVKGEYER